MSVLKGEKGFTLVEVLVASAILVITVLTLSVLLMQGYRIMNSAGKRSANIHLTQEEMEAAIKDPDFSSDRDDLEITRVPHDLEVFDETVHGTLVTVKRIDSGSGGGEVVYTYFEVSEGID